MLTILTRAFVITFCLWHMVAIVVYGWPGVGPEFMNQTANSIKPHIRPYMLVTSQWQKWNLFAPDPLRRVTEYILEVQQGDYWTARSALRPGKVSWWRRAHELKLARRLEQADEPMQERYVHLLCWEQGIEPGTNVRFLRRYHVIPSSLVPRSIAWWKSFQPTWKTKTMIETTCPSPVS